MRRLAILRPEPGASATVERARELGLDAFAVPLFAIEPLAWELPDSGAFDALLLTSANTVRQAGPSLERLLQLPAYAVGDATAAAAEDAGFCVAGSGDGGVDELLASIPPDLRLLHLCGEHRVAAPTSRPITALAVYRAAELAPPGRLREIEGETVAVHSPRAAKRLAELVDDAAIDRRTIRVAAISPGAAAAAGAGWEDCAAADQPNDTALLALAARLCDNPVTT
jgi:uroporphyrinogen-III synthase